MTILFWSILGYVVCGVLLLTYHMFCLQVLSLKPERLEEVVDEINSKTDYNLNADKIKERLNNFGLVHMIYIILFWPRILLLFFKLNKKTK